MRKYQSLVIESLARRIGAVFYVAGLICASTSSSQPSRVCAFTPHWLLIPVVFSVFLGCPRGYIRSYFQTAWIANSKSNSLYQFLIYHRWKKCVVLDKRLSYNGRYCLRVIPMETKTKRRRGDLNALGSFGRPCKICYSPYRNEIEKLHDEKGMSLQSIAHKYAKILNCTKGSMYQSVRRHISKKHKEKYKNVSNGMRLAKRDKIPGFEEAYGIALTFESAAEMLLRKGMEAFSDLSPKEALRLSATLQKTNLEGKKQNTNETALKLQIAKMFGGFIPKKTLQDGQEVTEVGKIEEGEIDE